MRKCDNELSLFFFFFFLANWKAQPTEAVDPFLILSKVNKYYSIFRKGQFSSSQLRCYFNQQ